MNYAQMFDEFIKKKQPLVDRRNEILGEAFVWLAQGKKSELRKIDYELDAMELEFYVKSGDMQQSELIKKKLEISLEVLEGMENSRGTMGAIADEVLKKIRELDQDYK